MWQEHGLGASRVLLHSTCHANHAEIHVEAADEFTVIFVQLDPKYNFKEKNELVFEVDEDSMCPGGTSREHVRSRSFAFGSTRARRSRRSSFAPCVGSEAMYTGIQTSLPKKYKPSMA